MNCQYTFLRICSMYTRTRIKNNYTQSRMVSATAISIQREGCKRERRPLLHLHATLRRLDKPVAAARNAALLIIPDRGSPALFPTETGTRWPLCKTNTEGRAQFAYAAHSARSSHQPLPRRSRHRRSDVEPGRPNLGGQAFGRSCRHWPDATCRRRRAHRVSSRSPCRR